MAGVAKERLSNIEAGAVVPSILTLQQIAIESLVQMMIRKQRELAIALLTAKVNQAHRKTCDFCSCA